MIRHLRISSRRHLPLLLLGLVAVTLTGCLDASQYPQSTLTPKGDYAEMVDKLFRTTLWLATLVFIIVEAGLLWAIFKFRGKPDDAEPKQVHGSTTVEIIWTVIPALVLAVVAVPTVQTIFETAKVPAASPDGQAPLRVDVVGHQWWWEFRYPELGITTANQLHVPVGRTVDLRMKTVDVLHSFWIPQFAGKRDVFPNRETRLWFTAKETGAFPGACAEFCGIQHGRMDFYVMVNTPEEFAGWVATRQTDSLLGPTGLPKPPAAPVVDTTAKAGKGDVVVATAPAMPVAPAAMADPKVAEGEKYFASKGCIGCHSLNSVGAPKGMIGPNLGGIGVRKMIAGGWLPNTDENLHRWIKTPQLVKTGVLMQVPEMTDAEVDALVAYLRTKQ
ncbi:MAG: cytochrome c oxidase subunit II [Gemmatimonadales bacterium]|nr:cytochrome c oxidase subunit II [Gemmatimonadales bacterium]